MSEKPDPVQEKREKRAQALASMGLVKLEGGVYHITTPSMRGQQATHIVSRDESGAVRCSCEEFAAGKDLDLTFRCEHILAIKYSRDYLPQEEKQMESTQQAPQQVTTTPPEVHEDETHGDFGTALRELRKNIDPRLIKQREGWRDRNGNVQIVDYVEWHTVADILDDTAPDWSHSIRDIREIGSIITVTVAITIDGVTREGIGTGTGQSELGIKKAEHDALKRAAVKFGVARDLYKKETEFIEHGGATPQDEGGFPSNPVARNLNDLITAKQLGMIRAIAREAGVDHDEECETVMNCKTDELSKKAASAFIQHLQELQRSRDAGSFRR
jgi:hypothetical protein